MSPFVMEDTYYGRTLIVKGEWSADVEYALKSQPVDALSLNRFRGWAHADDLTFLPELSVRTLLVLDPMLSNFAGIERACARVERISVADCDRRAKLPVGALPSLQTLSVYWGQISDSLDSAPKTLTQLRVIEGYPYENLEGIPIAGQLEAIRLYAAHRLTSLGGLSSFRQLKSLRLLDCRRISDLEDLPSVSGTLLELHFESCPKVNTIGAVAGLHKLERLVLINCKEIESLQPLRELKQLEALSAFGSTVIADGDLSVLLELPKLALARIERKRMYRPPVREIQAAILHHPAPTSPWN